MKNYSDNKKSLIITVITILLVIVITIFIGNSGVKVSINKEEISVSAFLFNESVKLSDIKKVELEKDLDYGNRSFGIGSPTVYSGNFNNDEFGDYKCAVYTATSKCIVISDKNNRRLVFNLKTNSETEGIYKLLTEDTPSSSSQMEY